MDYLFRLKKSQALADAIGNLITHPDKRNILAEKERQRGGATFTNEIMVIKYMEVYERLG